MNPAEFGCFERRPDSGVWYHPEQGKASFEPRICENPDCPLPGGEFMGSRQKGRDRFCSLPCAKRAVSPSYDARHERVRYHRGSASQFLCVDDCGRQAEDWSQIHGTTGLEPEHYEPRCVKCHRAYDAETVARGEAVGTATLTEARVRGIRASVGASQRELARLHNTTQQNIKRILDRTIWKHVE